jgi:hypothetical protein
MGTIVIKDVDEGAFKSLKSEAAKAGLKLGEAASQAFRLWVQQRALRKAKDLDRMRRAAEVMDKIRMRLRPAEEEWSVKEIRRWRRLRQF